MIMNDIYANLELDHRSKGRKNTAEELRSITCIQSRFMMRELIEKRSI